MPTRFADNQTFKIPEFPQSAHDQSRPEGWDVFNGDEIQRDDEMALFSSDDAALEFVRRRAAAGSAAHQLALEIHELGEKYRQALTASA